MPRRIKIINVDDFISENLIFRPKVTENLVFPSKTIKIHDFTSFFLKSLLKSKILTLFSLKVIKIDVFHQF